MILTCSGIYRTGKSLGKLPGETSRELIFIIFFFFKGGILISQNLTEHKQH